VFTRFADKGDIDDIALCKAVRDAERGLVAADLGGGLIKQRIARRGQGKSGGFRTLLVFRPGSRAFFVHGYAKNEKENIAEDELAALRKLARELLGYSDQAIARAVSLRALLEVMCDEEAVW
jgi:hypothetical protein